MDNWLPLSAYHSAHDPDLPAPPVRRVTLPAGTAFAHNMVDGPLPPEYSPCDVFYSDLPWQRGQAVFNERANAAASFADVITAASQIVTAGKPVIFVTGKHALRLLPAPQRILPTRLNRHEAVALIYGSPRGLVGHFPTATDVIRDLTTNYTHVGDPFCGYGLTLKTFATAGRRFTGSDYNPRCIGYIATHGHRWRPAPHV